MSSTIHGHSHQTIKHFRKQAASLEVLWIYMARANYENTAWPSARGLAKDTGFNKNTCLDARGWLVEHGALEPVTEYVRPDWRSLDDAKRQQLINLDRSEYYRPTGKLIIDGKEYSVLYNAVNQESDVLSHRTTTGPDVEHGSTELDTSKDSQLHTTKTTTTSRRSRQTDEDFAALCTAYENEIAMITPGMADTLSEALDDYPLQWCIDAIGIAVERNRRNWRYVEGILKNWRDEGRGDKRPPAHKAPPPVEPLEGAELEAAIERQMFGGKL